MSATETYIFTLHVPVVIHARDDADAEMRADGLAARVNAGNVNGLGSKVEIGAVERGDVTPA